MMKYFQNNTIKIFGFFLIFLATSCTVSQDISLKRGELYIPGKTKVHSIVLKNGDSLAFGNKYATFTQKDSNGVQQNFIEGYDQKEIWRKIPDTSVAKVYGEQSKFKTSEVMAVGILLLLLLSPPVVIYVLLL